MQTNLVTRIVNLTDLPALTDAQRAEITALVDLLDVAIDTSDMPNLPDEAWRNAVRGHKPLKTSTTVRIDADELASLRPR